MGNSKNQNRPPRGKAFKRIERREQSGILGNLNDDKWSGTDFTIAAKVVKNGDYRYINVNIQVKREDRELIKNGGWLESE